ncbi:hypothetical protein FGX01_00530, partial [Xylella fastidiosa subsp. multiplex]|nr:hypothetical protein [Xylella fastidiosa subsp. multiplex]
IQRAAGALSADLGQAVPRISRTEAGTLAPAFWAHRDGEEQPVMQFVRGGWDNLGDLPRPFQPALPHPIFDLLQGRPG